VRLIGSRSFRAALSAALCATALLAASPGSGAAPKPDQGPKARYPWKQRVQAAREFAADRAGTVSFAVVGERARMRGFKSKREFHSASVVKVMLMVSYLRQPGVRNRDLNSSDKALLEPMITRSDNATASAIYGMVGDTGLNKLARAAHMSDFEPNPIWGASVITAADQAPFMYRLRRYIPGRHRRYAFHLLSHIVSYQRWGVPPAKPRGWEVFFKGGFIPSGGGWRIHQVALLRRDDRRLALAVLSEGNPSLEYGGKTIQGVTARLLRDYNKFF
jgi:Beta-lactamase enzyme family